MKLVDINFISSFHKVQSSIHENAIKKGFWEIYSEKFDGIKIALMHSELSEALEAMRDDDKESEKIPQISHLTEKLADTVIGIMDFAEARELNLAEAILLKHRFNCDRPYMHGGKKF